MPYAILVCLLSLSLSAQSDFRVEPPNWWVGMQNDTLQLLVYGGDAGALKVTSNRAGLDILATHRADSPNYLFVDLLVDKGAAAGTYELILTDPGGNTTTHPYELKERERPATDYRGFDARDVVYLLTPDRFANGDPSNDSVADTEETTVDRDDPSGRHGGDLRGMIDHVDYLDDMGFTALWPSPVLENDMPAYSYHGYAITDYYAVDPRFGTLADYRELADSLRGRGMKLIMDQVVNHCGSGHWWMDDLPFGDWLNFQDSARMTTHRRTVHQDPYAAEVDRKLMTQGWFVSTMPDLNQRNPFLATYLIQNSIWWIETLGLGGIRQDTYPYPDPDFLSDWTCRIMSEYPNFNIVGEEWSYDPAICAYWQAGKENPDGYTSCLGSVMDFPLQAALTAALEEEESWDGGLIKLYEALANDYLYADPRKIMVFADNHDMDRLATGLGGDPAKIKMALTYLLTIRGIPQIYYGTEVMIDNDEGPGNHGIIRTDMPGGWAGGGASAFTGEGLSGEKAEVQTYVSQLLQWRKEHPVIATGKTIHYAPRDGIYVYGRYDDSERVVVVMNKSKAATIIRPTDYRELFGDYRSITALDGSTVEDIRVEPTSAGVYVLR